MVILLMVIFLIFNALGLWVCIGVVYDNYEAYWAKGLVRQRGSRFYFRFVKGKDSPSGSRTEGTEIPKLQRFNTRSPFEPKPLSPMPLKGLQSKAQTRLAPFLRSD